MPASPLSRGEKVMIAVVTILSLWGLGSTIWSLLP